MNKNENSIRENIMNGDIVRHFKKEKYTGDDKNRYLYKILDMNAHSADDYRRVVVYQALYSYGDVNYGTYVRDYEEFMSEVDHVKYTEINQKYRFEIEK